MRLLLIFLIVSVFFGCNRSLERSKNDTALNEQDSLRFVVADIMALPDDTASSVTYEVLTTEETDTYFLERLKIKSSILS